MIDTETTGQRVAAGRTARFFAKHQARAAALESAALGVKAGVWLDSQGFIVSRMSTPVTRDDAALVYVAGFYGRAAVSTREEGTTMATKERTEAQDWRDAVGACREIRGECRQCGAPMNPVERMLGPVCGECVRPYGNPWLQEALDA